MENEQKAEALKAMYAAADEMRAQHDNLLLAIAHIAAAGRVTVMPSPMLFGESKPVILLPQNMYDRMFEILPEKEAE